MQTKDVVKMGIDRNFLLRCEKPHELIKPKRNESDFIINEEYKSREYTQEEIEIVWNAYLCRKMGLSFEEIKKLTNGEEIRIRDSLNTIIEKYERDIEELRVLIEFMKYVKGIGFIPRPPQALMGSESFKEYLFDFIKYLDPDRKLKEIINVAELISETSDIEAIDQEVINSMEATFDKVVPHYSNADAEEYTAAFISLKDKIDFDPGCDEVQSIIQKMFVNQKKLSNTLDLSAFDFATSFLKILSNDSELGEVYKKLLGKSTCDFLIDALVQFLIIKEPEKVRKQLLKGG